MTAPTGYKQLPSGFWVRDDGSGPYFVDVATGTPTAIGAVVPSVVALTTAEFNALVGASGLTEGVQYYVYDGPARWIAKGPNTYDGIGFDQDGTIYFGNDAFAAQTEIDLAAGTWATRPLTGFTAGVAYFRRMTDIGDKPGGTTMCWLGGTSTAWSLVAPLRLRLRGAGSTGTSAQYPTNTRHALPEALMAACSRFDAHLKFDQSDETTTLASWRLKLGSAGTSADATICAPTGTPMAAGDNQRAYPMSFNIESTTTIRADAISNASGVGWQTSPVNSVADAVVSLTAGDDTSDALYLGVDYTLGGGGGTAITTMLMVTLWP